MNHCPPEQVCDAGLAEAMSTLSLPRVTEHMPARLAAILGLRRRYKAVPKSAMQGQEAWLGPGPLGHGGHGKRWRTLLQGNLLFHITPCGHDLKKNRQIRI